MYHLQKKPFKKISFPSKQGEVDTAVKSSRGQSDPKTHALIRQDGW